MKLVWTGPFTIQKYLDNAISRSAVWAKRWPPEGNAVYLVSKRSWRGEPTSRCSPLYVGGNTGESERFRTRIGDLIADMFCFFGGGTGHHSGGPRQSLWEWCDHNRVHPGDLYLAWARPVGKHACARCAEILLYDAFPRARRGHLDGVGLRNKVRPATCSQH